MDPSLLHTIELDEQFLIPLKIKELVHGATSRTDSALLLSNLKWLLNWLLSLTTAKAAVPLASRLLLMESRPHSLLVSTRKSLGSLKGWTTWNTEGGKMSAERLQVGLHGARELWQGCLWDQAVSSSFVVFRGLHRGSTFGPGFVSSVPNKQISSPSTVPEPYRIHLQSSSQLRL